MNREMSANTTLSHYRIVSKIGAGGMGEVYLAQRNPDFLYVAVDPYFKDLHSDPRFVDLMHRAGFPD